MHSLIFLPNDLALLVSEMLQKPCGRVSFCEDFEEDIIEWEDKALLFRHVIPLLNQRFNINIQSYDVIEINETEIGFKFNF